MTPTQWQRPLRKDQLTYKFLYMSTLTAQAETAALMPRQLTSSFCAWPVSPSLPVNRTLSSAIGWLLFKLCWRTERVKIRLQVLEKCERMIECLELQGYSERNPEQPDKEGGYDHLTDAGLCRLGSIQPAARSGRAWHRNLY